VSEKQRSKIYGPKPMEKEHHAKTFRDINKMSLINQVIIAVWI
jgi:hypothetical protein